MLSGGDAKKMSLQLGAFTAPPENRSLVASTRASSPLLPVTPAVGSLTSSPGLQGQLLRIVYTPSLQAHSEMLQGREPQLWVSQ